jgi:pilus assembly protein CpaB
MARVLLIVAALGVAALTAFLVKSFLDQKESEYAELNAARATSRVDAVQVLVAERDLPTGTILKADHLRWQPWPETSLQESYIVRQTNQNVNGYTGSAIRRGISAGEPILQTKLLKPGDAGFLSGVLAPGKRAATVKVNAETGTAGFILPGDRVDVMLTSEVQHPNESGGRDKKVVSETILQDMRVLAIDQTLDDLNEQTRLGSTVTLEVTPREAQELAVAKQLGGISLVLRSLSRDPESDETTTARNGTEPDPFARQRRILVAKQNLPAGMLLRDTDLNWIVLPSEDFPSGAIIDTLRSGAELRGAYLKSEVGAGQPILDTDIIRPSEQGFIVAALNPGMRAVSVPINQVSAVSGFISPGDRVDIMMTQQIADTSDAPVMPTRMFSETILSNVRLLAVEQTVDAGTGKPRAGQTVTLELTPRQAEMVVVAMNLGQLSLSVRSVPDADTPIDENWAVSDLTVSNALKDFLLRGTPQDPDLNIRRQELYGGGNVSQGQVTVYRSVLQSNITVTR